MASCPEYIRAEAVFSLQAKTIGGKRNEEDRYQGLVKQNDKL